VLQDGLQQMKGTRTIGAALIATAALLTLHLRAADTLDFSGRLGPIAPENRLSEPGYYIWCGSGIRGEDGKYYLFYSRWESGSEGRARGDERLFKDMSGWLKYSEIAVAMAESPTGPFRHLTTVLRGTGDTNRWDCYNAHNPHVQRFGARVCLYYIANNLVPHKDRWMQHADGQRIGVAVARSVAELVAGHFERSAQPLIAPDGTNTFCRVVNPSVTRGRDGRYLMMFKTRSAAAGGQMSHWVAAADEPDGPFRLAGPALTDPRFEAEDPCFWYDRERDRYYAIVKDYSRNHRDLSPQFGALALLTSVKGTGDWQPAAHPVVSLREFTDVEGCRHPLANLERPQLLFDEQGKPVCLYAAAGEQDPSAGHPSFNLHFSILGTRPAQPHTASASVPAQ
jgi:hypothetical protein